MDPRLQIALAIHEGATRISAGGCTNDAAIKLSIDAMQEILPDLNMHELRMKEIMRESCIQYVTKTEQVALDKISSGPGTQLADAITGHQNANIVHR